MNIALTQIYIVPLDPLKPAPLLTGNSRTLDQQPRLTDEIFPAMIGLPHALLKANAMSLPTGLLKPRIKVDHGAFCARKDKLSIW